MLKINDYKRSPYLCRRSVYNAYNDMKMRCRNPRIKNYKNYGGRGIRVCKRWLKSFLLFIEDLGPKPTLNHSLDRINNDGGYKPSNCRWATRKQQRDNQRKIRGPYKKQKYCRRGLHEMKGTNYSYERGCRTCRLRTKKLWRLKNGHRQ